MWSAKRKHTLTLRIHFRIWTSQPASERVTEAEGKMHVLNWQALYFTPNAKRQIATWVCMHQNVIKSKSRALTFFTAGACTEFYSECFCLFVEKIIDTLSKSQVRQHIQNLLPRYLFVSVLHNTKFEFVMKQPQKHLESIWSHTQLFHSASETSSIVPHCSFIENVYKVSELYLLKERVFQVDQYEIFLSHAKGNKTLESLMKIVKENCERQSAKCKGSFLVHSHVTKYNLAHQLSKKGFQFLLWALKY